MNAERFRKLFIFVFVPWLTFGCSFEGETVKFFQDKYEIRKPWLWWTMDDLNDEADVQMGNLFMEAYLVVLSQSKSEFGDNYELDEFSENLSALIEGGLTGLKTRKPALLTINGYPAIKRVIEGRFEQLPVIYWHISLDTGDDYHQMIVWSVKRYFVINEPFFKSAIYSIRKSQPLSSN